ncbi:hypothetical protein ACFV2D_11665 [Streptomyces capillispiralis]|uniref:hypothetical protein n=1 Tax=Streptomyces capillispiralis TaxID=68182 RepID=UPI00369867EE
MRALPARRIALGACCAALLVGITGPTAMAADAARVASSDTLLVQARNLAAHDRDLTPVADLVEAVREADGGHLPPGEARQLGEAAQEALEAAMTRTRAAVPGDTDTDAEGGRAVTAPATETPTTETGADTETEADVETEATSDLLDALREAVQGLVDLLLSTDEEDTAQVPSSVDGLLTHLGNLVDALIGTEPQASVLPAPATTAPQTQVPLLQGVTLPVLTPLTSLLLPRS